MKTSATNSLFSKFEILWRSRAAALLAGVGIFCALQSPAVTLSWSGGGAPDGNWSNDANWGFAGIPTNGDTLIFSFPQPNQINTNNIPGLTLNQIRFLGAGGGYNIRGNAFTVTNHIFATNTAGVNIISNNITFGAPTQTVTVGSNASLTLGGGLSGTTGMTKAGLGTLTFANAPANSYTGTTLVTGGLLQLSKTSGEAITSGGALVISNATVRELVGFQLGSVPITVNGGFALFDLNGFNDTVGNSLTFINGGQVQTLGGTMFLEADPTISVSNSLGTISGNLNIGSGTCTIQCDGSLSLTANVSGSANIVKTGINVLALSGANTYTGVTTINAGELDADSNLALGATNGGTVVNGLAELWLINAHITNETLTLNSTSPSGALQDSLTGDWTGPIILSTNVFIEASSALGIDGPISGPGGFTKISASTLTLKGSAANTYAGTTTVNAGTLVLGKSFGTLAVPGNLVVSSGGTATLANDEQTSQSADVLINAGGLFEFSTFDTYIDTLRGSGTVNFGIGGWIWIGLNNGTSTFDGQFTGVGLSGGWTVGKTGTGTFTMNGNNTYSAGNVTIQGGGKMVINGSHARPPVRLDAGTTLGGSGTVGDIGPYFGNVGIVAPGTSPSILTCSNVTFVPAGLFNVELTGPTAGTDYDQLNVRGTCNVTGAGLGINLAFTKPVAVGQQFVIINNDGGDAITGNFLGYGGGASFLQNGYGVVISYVGGSGNDVVLTLTNVPGAAVGSVVTSGNGDGAIAPNECNYLGVILTNKSGTPMTGITATLASITAGVVVPESPVPYPNIAGNGKATNTVPFQISTTPDFVCGSTIDLVLTVTTTSSNSFTIPVTLTTGVPSVAAVRFDNNTTVNVPDTGTIESTNNVAVWTGGPITKVAVSLWLSAPADGDLALTLIAPNGSSVDLSSGNGGSGLHYGIGSADGNRTTFDDAAVTSITAGAPPFVGSFKPEASLSSLNGTTPVVGNWRLRVQDTGFFGAPDTLRNWSLFLYGTDCGTGSGLCELCPNVTISSAFLAPSLSLTNYYTEANGTNSVCGVTKPCPITFAGPYQSENFLFRNGPSDACITVTVTNISVGGGMAVGAYSAGFDPLSPDRCPTYLGNPANFPSAGAAETFSFNITSNAVFTVTALGGSAGAYKLTVTGGDCRPVLNATDIGAGNAKLDWTTAAPGYQLESTNALPGATVWPAITNTPAVINSRYTVTNTVPSANQFYHLRKPLP